MKKGLAVLSLVLGLVFLYLGTLASRVFCFLMKYHHGTSAGSVTAMDVVLSD